MTKKISKIIFALLAVMLIFSLLAPVFATDYTSPDQLGGKSSDLGDKVNTISGKVIGVVQVVGTTIAVIMLIMLGVKYVMAAPDEKAEIKKSALIYVVAAIFIFGATNILGWLKTTAEDITNI